MHLVYLTSCSYSGSTLLTLLLNTHPQIATVGELKANINSKQSQILCSCGQNLHHCAFWTTIIKRTQRLGADIQADRLGTQFGYPESKLFQLVCHAKVRSRWFENMRRFALSREPFAKTFTQVLMRNRLLIETIADHKGGTHFLDSSKDVVRLMYFLQSKYWQISVIRMVRDGRGTMNSFQKHFPSLSPRKIARMWTGVDRQFENLVRLFPEMRTITVRYEDLVDDVASQLKRIALFLNLSPNFSELDFPTGHIFGNDMRLKRIESIRLDESWRQQLSPSALQIFEQIAGPTNRKLGYD